MVVINRFFCDNYIFKVNACELCKAIYPDQVLIDGHKYDIYDIERPETDPYLIMEVVGMPVGKNIKLIKIGKDFNISLGRGEDSDVRVNDSSISQKHASLRFEQSIQEFVLQDEDSKFGSLLLIQEPVKLSPERETTIQIGCTLLNLKLEKQS